MFALKENVEQYNYEVLKIMTFIRYSLQNNYKFVVLLIKFLIGEARAKDSVTYLLR